MKGYNEIIPGSILDFKFGTYLIGYVTDFNVYSRFFEEKQSMEWTTCRKEFENGDIFSFNIGSTITELNITRTDRWGPVPDPQPNGEIIQVDQSEICPTKRNDNHKIEFFWSGGY